MKHEPAGFWKTAVSYVRMRIAVFRQKPNEVFRRNPGGRTLVGPYPVQADAVADWEFALLSVAAYGRSAPKTTAAPAGTVTGLVLHAVAGIPKGSKERAPVPLPDVDDELKKAGWTRWPDFPDPKLEDEMRLSHLRAEVWENRGRSALAVAFGGTVFTSGKDWMSNLRWFTPWKKDEYTEIVQRFGPDFVQSLAARQRPSNTAHPKGLTLFSTGHSLGGGLAQQFAYSLPLNTEGIAVSEVYAFDPSPVTGFFSVDKATRDHNKIGLKIARIYERGEVLAILRSFTSLIFRPAAKDPEIRGARFSLFYSWNSIAGHSMVELADKLSDIAQAPSSVRQDECERKPSIFAH